MEIPGIRNSETRGQTTEVKESPSEKSTASSDCQRHPWHRRVKKLQSARPVPRITSLLMPVWKEWAKGRSTWNRKFQKQRFQLSSPSKVMGDTNFSWPGCVTVHVEYCHQRSLTQAFVYIVFIGAQTGQGRCWSCSL
ncbi:uncharacterized protein LOC144579716 isoform X2 [Callithrix jacchus]